VKNTGDLHTKILKSVARSFYLSIRVLPETLRPVMSLGYLLCRAADTIADTPSASAQERLKLLSEFKALFGAFPISPERLKEFIGDLTPANLGATPHEQKLLARLPDCAATFGALTKTDQSLVQEVVLSVIKGMEMDLKTFGDVSETVRSIATNQDLETYIHHIGGEPGRFWTNVCLAHVPEMRVSNRDQLVKDGIVFGTGLQMVNILRDLPADLKNGRCYIPEELLRERGLTVQDLLSGNKNDVFLTLYHHLIEQTVFRLERGRSYVTQIGWAPMGLKLAVWLPMVIGLETLERLRRTETVLTKPEPVKIKRWEIYWLVAASLWKVSPFCIARQSRRAAIRT
jgi:farnesyl-diphosphate farnesyltransferase